MFFSAVRTLTNSKSCPDLRLHTYSEKPEQLTNCLWLRGIIAKILSDQCHFICCAWWHWHISRKTCMIHAISICGWFWTLSLPFLCVSYFESCSNSSCSWKLIFNCLSFPTYFPQIPLIIWIKIKILTQNTGNTFHSSNKMGLELDSWELKLQ